MLNKINQMTRKLVFLYQDCGYINVYLVIRYEYHDLAQSSVRHIMSWTSKEEKSFCLFFVNVKKYSRVIC